MTCVCGSSPPRRFNGDGGDGLAFFSPAFAPPPRRWPSLHGVGDAERFSIRDDSTILTALRAARAALASCASDVEATAARRAGGGGGGARGDSHGSRDARMTLETMGEKNVASDRVRRAPRRAPRAESAWRATHSRRCSATPSRGRRPRDVESESESESESQKSNPTRRTTNRQIPDLRSERRRRRRRRRRFFRATFCAAKCFARRFCAQLASRSATIFTPRPFATRGARACARASRRKPLAPPPRRWKPRRARARTRFRWRFARFSKGLMRRLRYGDAVARAIARVGDAFGSVNVRKFVVPALVRALGEDTREPPSRPRRGGEAAERFERFERVSKKSSSQKDDDDRDVTPAAAVAAAEGSACKASWSLTPMRRRQTQLSSRCIPRQVEQQPLFARVGRGGGARVCASARRPRDALAFLFPAFPGAAGRLLIDGILLAPAPSLTLCVAAAELVAAAAARSRRTTRSRARTPAQAPVRRRVPGFGRRGRRTPRR